MPIYVLYFYTVYHAIQWFTDLIWIRRSQKCADEMNTYTHAHTRRKTQWHKQVAHTHCALLTLSLAGPHNCWIGAKKKKKQNVFKVNFFLSFSRHCNFSSTHTHVVWFSLFFNSVKSSFASLTHSFYIRWRNIHSSHFHSKTLLKWNFFYTR